MVTPAMSTATAAVAAPRVSQRAVLDWRRGVRTRSGWIDLLATLPSISLIVPSQGATEPYCHCVSLVHSFQAVWPSTSVRTVPLCLVDGGQPTFRRRE